MSIAYHLSPSLSQCNNMSRVIRKLTYGTASTMKEAFMFISGKGK